MNNFKVLIIQTAFTGDVILATSMIESIHHAYPEASIYFLLRKGNEDLFKGHPYLKSIFILDKKQGFLKSSYSLLREIRKMHFDYVFNLQRYARSGILSLFSGAKKTAGFDKNPFSFGYNKTVKHLVDGRHETERNHEVLCSLLPCMLKPQKLYPTVGDLDKIKSFQKQAYVCMAPSSVWFTKRLPEEKWISLIQGLADQATIYLLGGPSDRDWCDRLIKLSGKKNIANLSGELSFLESVALMSGAAMNYVNDSAPLHMASACNAPVRAFFCSTVSKFGFTPTSKDSKIYEAGDLDCRPCGIHGLKKCPLNHFRCGNQIQLKEALQDGMKALTA